MPHIVAHVAIIGRLQLMPGILPVTLGLANTLFHVSHAFQDFVQFPNSHIKVDTNDCILFTVEHVGTDEVDLKDASCAFDLLEKSLSAISEATLWLKANDTVGEITSYIRQFGTADVKCFAAENQVDVIGYVNPTFQLSRADAELMAGFLSNMVVSNGPAKNPVPAVTKRLMSSLDLINLGFHTEAFINLFSLIDDLTQEILKLGLKKSGLDEGEQKSLLRAIKEERLSIYLCTLAKVCGWQSLSEANKELYNRVKKVNTARNNIMHGSERLMPKQTLEHMDTLIELIEWLRTNPFGYSIPKFPNLKLIEPKFFILPLNPDDKAPE
ncbi:hypothetical protein ACFPOU_17455 [Massilia jejuensis]|uniref:Apea-like HEPN domain-containing protein n=1 Tax=Massilia jejuensis TaxID=648894 RepID=A0ABW0PMC1_9BURK